MKSITNNKSVLIAIIIFGFAIIGYNLFFKADQSLSTEGGNAQAIGNNVVALDQALSTVSFDTSLFVAPAYRSLVDHMPTLTPVPAGRTNPFAPLGQ